MKPIGQTFTIVEPSSPTGPAGRYLTRVDVYFKSISSTFGVEMQIRTTENGEITSTRLPFGSKILLPSDTYANGSPIIVASDDATLPTSFIFDTPVFLPANKTYGFTIAPLGGNPDYNIWTATIGGTDVTTGTPIYTNNDSGDLFISSNDVSWDPVINEDIKYTLYVAKFTSQSGSAYFRSPDEEWIAYKDVVGNFMVRETLVYGNGYFDNAVLNVGSVTGSFSVGDTVYQTNGSANVSGVVYAANSTVIKVSNATGRFAQTSGGTPLLFSANSGANCAVNVLLQNTVVSSSNTITVPDSTIHTVGDVIYVQTSNRSNTAVVQITGKPSNTQISVNTAVSFSDSSAMYGRVRSNGTLNGGYSGSSTYNNITYAVIDSTTANTSVNLYGVSNVQVIGVISGASANLIGAHDPKYNSFTTNFNSLTYANTSMNWYFSGFASDGSRTPDGSFMPITPGAINEFIDVERVTMSRSNEIGGGLIPARQGNNSVVVRVDFASQNDATSPVIDTIRQNVTYTYNIVPASAYLTGSYLSISSTSGIPSNGAVITQTTGWGYVTEANSSTIIVNSVNGYFTNTTYTTSDSKSGSVITATRFSEAKTNGYYRTSRYIAKSVILAAGQDSEDMRAYMAAFRPATTDFRVYARIINATDGDVFTSKDWSRLTELSSPSLLSSKVNIDDQVELEYGFPSSQLLYGNNVVANSSTTVISCQSTAGLTNNSFVYLSSVTAKSFNVREIMSVINATAFSVDRAPSFSDSNSALGIVPGLESTSGAFLYDQNNYVVRYVTAQDAVHDSYIQFAMKIVPTSDSSSLVPRASDLRVLALQV